MMKKYDEEKPTRPKTDARKDLVEEWKAILDNQRENWKHKTADYYKAKKNTYFSSRKYTENRSEEQRLQEVIEWMRKEMTKRLAPDAGPNDHKRPCKISSIQKLDRDTYELDVVIEELLPPHDVMHFLICNHIDHFDKEEKIIRNTMHYNIFEKQHLQF
ncbi:hypothetical protein RFI_26570 [Reticulomyxa filosa]|uniref:Uncharacterized protein n=1 Tax=Reticulomyxa filosa TaxID=46433 RepID=X6MAY2_RETFI|nr:hypothetical protein RFI_26570 [Reticulomyxa filosa]|eukprot:ETO10806.1 hypothetical protein RFI_26570 [Reticulomyxa filosa]